ncbi:MAG TPA: TonB-dependent receptor [Stellaceae bacterium]|nr:TonB-dependent receptor [Stellaceae bacterium]
MGIAAISSLIALQSPAAQTIEELKSLSIDQLANIKITSVSKSAEPLSDAAAAIYVISHDDIIRSGATTIPEILRLAPNLEVAQLNASTYAISARGFNVGNNASMSNKLLVLIDGRSVYTPLFAGVYWDMLGVLPEDIERIEVISGPGATLWGSNAVNGVINIITRKAADTQGGVLDLGAGNQERAASLQYGGRLTGDLTYRVHAEGYQFSPNKTAAGFDAEDAWSKPQGGFRVDWTPPGEFVSVQSDIFQASEEPGASIGGRDLVASWQHQLDDGSSFQTQAYYDVAKRHVDNGGGGFTVDTYDLSGQHSFALGSWNQIIWGLGDRIISYEIENTPTLLFEPAGRTLNLANLFVQDTAALTNTVKLAVGTKLENEPYTGVQLMPSARISWKVTDNALLWSAVSRAVRAPTPVDRDLIERSGSVDVLRGSFNFMPEVLTAYEIGTRVQASPRVSFSISAFYNFYDDLRSIEVSPVTFLPLKWGNLMEGRVYGTEVWGTYRVADWWRLSAGFNVQHEHLRFKPGSSEIGGLSFAADDPNHQASLRSSMDLGKNVTADAFLRYVGALHNPGVPDYAELDLRLGWKVTSSLGISISGFNLIHSRHPEFVEPGLTDEVPRSFFVDTRWTF